MLQDYVKQTFIFDSNTFCVDSEKTKVAFCDAFQNTFFIPVIAK